MPEPDQAKNTPTLNLYKPDLGEAEWGAALNSDMDILDSALQGLDYTFENINIIKLGGNPIDLGKGIAGSGTQRVCIANDDTNFSQIEVNTRTTATNLTSVSTKLSSPLGVYLLDDHDATMGINGNPLVVYNPLDSDGKFIPLAIRIQSAQGNDLDLGSGVITHSTLRVVSATDDPVVEALQSIDQDFKDSIISATYNEKDINIQNVMLRELDGTPTGVQVNPLWTSLMQDGDPVVFDFGSGNYSSNTLRTVSATDDPNLAAIKTASETLVSATGTAGGDIPGRVVQLGKVQETFNEEGDVTSLKLTTIKGDDNGGVYTYVKGGRVGTTFVDEAGDYVGVPDNALFFRNADHPEDRGQSAGKPFYVNITDPVNISNGLNVVQLGGYAISRKRGTIEEGTQRVCIADNDTNLSRIVIQIETIIEKIRWIIDHPKVKYTVTASVTSGLGMIAPPYYTVSSGRSATFFMIPESGYQIGSIALDGVDVGNKNPTQTISNITKDMVLTATFTQLPAVTYTITTSIYGGGGSISPFGAYVVGQGGTATITMIPGSGWKIIAIRVDGAITGSVANTYVIANVQANHTVSVEFGAEEVTKHTITASTIGSGTISPSGSTEVTHGTNQSYTITPSSGYQVAQVTVDGVPVLGVGTSTYSFTNVLSDHTIQVVFEVIPVQTYNLTTSILGGLGTISPSGTTKIPKGGESNIVVTPATGYQISLVRINGVIDTLHSGQIGYIELLYKVSNMFRDELYEFEFEPLLYSRAGNALIVGGGGNPAVSVEYLTIETTGSAGNYGNVTYSRQAPSVSASTTKGYVFGGLGIHSVCVEVLTIATKGSSTYLSGEYPSQGVSGCCSNGTTGYHLVGDTFYSINYSTGAVTSDAGVNLTSAVDRTGFSNRTRGVFAGGEVSGTLISSILYFNMGSGFSTYNYGSLSIACRPTGCSNNSRAIISTNGNTGINKYECMTIATAGSVSNFGSSAYAELAGAAVSSPTRAVFCGGHQYVSTKSSEYVTIATTGSATNFGELTLSRQRPGGCSSSHGGL